MTKKTEDKDYEIELFRSIMKLFLLIQFAFTDEKTMAGSTISDGENLDKIRKNLGDAAMKYVEKNYKIKNYEDWLKKLTYLNENHKKIISDYFDSPQSEQLQIFKPDNI